jgi:hypothetical protein
MIRIALGVFFLLNLGGAALGWCDETGSYNEVWVKKARERESGRQEREAYNKSLSDLERARVSDFEIYPTLIMECNTGFSEGLAKVRIGGKVGFIDTSGQIVIEANFSDAGRFSEGLAPAEAADGKWGFIDRKGTFVISPRFDWALLFREGLALVQIGEKWGFVNKSGEVVIPTTFDHANSFSEGLAHVQIYKDRYFSGYIDKTGKWVIPPIFNGGDDFIDGYTIADVDVLDQQGRYRYTEAYRIDRSGKRLEEVDPSRTKRQAVLLDSDEFSVFFDGYKTGYRDKSGKVIWKPSK